MFYIVDDPTGTPASKSITVTALFTSRTFTTSALFAGTMTQTSNSATAFESGPNGATNPVVRIVNSVASSATGITITGNAAAAGATIAAISSGTNEPLILNGKGSGGVYVGGLPAGLGGGNPFGVRIASDNHIAFAAQGAGVPCIFAGTDSGVANILGLRAAVAIRVFNAGTASIDLNANGIIETVAAGMFALSSTAASTGTADIAFARNAASVAELNNGTAGQWGAVKCGVRDAGTTTAVPGLTVGHQSTATPDVGLGSAVLFNINSSTTADQNAAQIAARWSTATHASRTADVVISQVNAAAALAETWRSKAAGGVQTTYVGLAHQLVGCIFTKTADTTVGGSSTETDLTGTGVGTVTLPANFFVAGKTIHLKAKGHFSTDVAAPGTMTLMLRLGGLAGTQIVTTGAKTPAGGCTAEFWEIDIICTCRSVGAAGTVMASGNFFHGDDSTNVLYEWEMTNTAAITIDTTAAQAIALTYKNGGTDADDTLTCTLMTVDVQNN